MHRATATARVSFACWRCLFRIALCVLRRCSYRIISSESMMFVSLICAGTDCLKLEPFVVVSSATIFFAF